MSRNYLLFAGLTMLCAGLASASEWQGPSRMHWQDDGSKAAAETSQSISIVQFGDHELQVLDYYPVESSDPAPLVLFVHGGGWTGGDKQTPATPTKVSHFQGRGFHFASTNYRLVPEATIEQQVTDVALALASLLKDAEKLNIDRDRVVLLGHSAGGHIVSLLGTDPRYLASAGLSHEDIAGIISLDISIYDAAHRMSEFGPGEAGNMGVAFGTDTERHRALSPALHTVSPNAPSFLILHVDRPLVGEASEDFARLLRDAGSQARVQEIETESSNGHREINVRMGEPAFAGTAAVDNWLGEIFD